MLRSLSIRNIVLIERLDITFGEGFCALTGETGAGKSILIDALGLATGNRSTQNYIRSGTEQATVAATFQLPPGHPAFAILQGQGLEDAEDTVILRRMLNQDGRSRAFVNDQPVSLKLLQELGQTLIEVHGQFDQLLDAASHRDFLDTYIKAHSLRSEIAEKYRRWQATALALNAAQQNAHHDQQQLVFLQHVLKELEELDIQENEEELLTQERTRLMHYDKHQKALEAAHLALSGDAGAGTRLYEATRAIEKINTGQPCATLQKLLTALEKTNQELLEAVAQLDAQRHNQDKGYTTLEQVEERLFKLRAAARKYGCLISQLVEKREQCRTDLNLIENRDSLIDKLQKEAALQQEDYLQCAQRLSALRKSGAKQLDQAIMQELAPLKLDRASFETAITSLPAPQWTENGVDKVQFTVSTNPGSPAGPLAAIASGGERSRFMLALKVALAGNGLIPSMVFDEIDSGVGGAVAYAIGERLARLAENVQVLAVTHSPQVAARAQSHLRIEKCQEGSAMVTRIIALDVSQRREEVARMLAGDQVTAEARAAADQLLQDREK